MKNWSWKGVLFLLIPCVSLPTLSGCLAASLSAFIPEAGSLTARNGVDSDLLTMRLASKTTSDTFTKNARIASTHLGYQVNSIMGSEYRIMLRRLLLIKSSNALSAYVGKSWQYTVSLTLENDGQTVDILSKTAGSSDHAGPGSARKIGLAFQKELGSLYANK
ncbi:MAG TPA: hypothetical protein VMV38_01755 [Candidatus Paceibacterota bacterium]|nr:hypothetical protein [Candidatus Paceibacterota bacterium]